MKPVEIIAVAIFITSGLSYVLTLEDVESSTISGLESESTLCTSDQCVMKCCPFGKYITVQRRKRVCEYFDNTTRDFAELVEDIFHEHPDMSKLNLTVKAGIFEANKTFNAMSINVINFFNVYLTEYPEVNLEVPNAYERWTRIPNNMFCWDYVIRRRNHSLSPGVWVAFSDDQVAYEPITKTIATLQTTGMLVSSFFLALVLVVYGTQPELRNLSGKILIAYVASLLAAFLLLAFMRIQLYEALTCHVLTFLIYFFFLASFCWMNVMSYDIWWASRDYGKGRPSNRRRRSDCCLFLKFCSYAFGLPLVMTVIVVIINEIDMTHVPWFITPKVPEKGCFISGFEKFLYMYIPMMILMSVNWVFYVMTAVNVWRLTHGTSGSVTISSPFTHRSNWNRFMAFLRLSFVLCFNWVFEVVSFIYPGFTFWYITDFLNDLLGVVIFLIFVCRRKILRKLVKRWRPGQNSLESITDSDSEVRETQALEECANSK